MNHSKHQNGTVSELLAASHFARHGYRIARPINDFGEYDLIVDDGSLKRVQVKTVYWDNAKKRHLMSFVTSHRRGKGIVNKKYSADSFDLLCGIHAESGTMYLIPCTAIIGRRGVTVYPEGKPKTVNGRYDDFEQYARRL